MPTTTAFEVGELRHAVTIRAPAGVLHETNPVDVATGVPMKIQVLALPFQQREQLGLGGLQTATLYTLVCRYRTDVQPAYILVEACCTQRTFQIVAVIPSDRREATEMTCVTAS